MYSHLHVLYCAFMQSGLHTETSLSERMRRYLLDPKVVRSLFETSLVLLAEHLGCRGSFCPHQRRHTSWTVDAAGHALLDDRCVTDHDSPSGKACFSRCWKSYGALYCPRLHSTHSTHRYHRL